MPGQRRAGQLVYINKTVMFDRVSALHRPCAYPGAGLRHASGSTGPRNSEPFFFGQLFDPGIVEITGLQKSNQTLPLKTPTWLQFFFEHVSFS